MQIIYCFAKNLEHHSNTIAPAESRFEAIVEIEKDKSISPAFFITLIFILARPWQTEHTTG